MAEEKLLIPSEEYLTSGVHIGTKLKNGYSSKYIHKSRPDGLKIIDTSIIDTKLKALINFISQLEPSEFVVMGRRENAKKPLQMLNKLIGCDVFTGRYLPGKLTNANLEDFKEYKAVIVCDPLTDKNILNEAFVQGTFIAAFCDTNNRSNKIDLVIPLNNKGKRSLGLAFYLIAKNYLVNKEIIKEKEFTYTIDDFSDE